MERCALLAKDRSLFCQAKDQRQENCLVGPALLLVVEEDQSVVGAKTRQPERLVTHYN